MSRLKDEFIAYLREQAANHSIYVWGAQGQTGSEITEEWIRKRETSEKNALRAISFLNAQKARSTSPYPASFDCSGLVMFFLHDLRACIGCDLTAAGLYRLCCPIERCELIEGDLVFRHDGVKIHHVGVYAGGGSVIEAMGRDTGVVERNIDASGSGYWNRYGRLVEIFREDADGSGARAAFAYPRGSVNVRTGAGKEHRVAAVAHAFDPVLAMPEKDGWREVSVAIKGEMVHGYMSAKFLKEA